MSDRAPLPSKKYVKKEIVKARADGVKEDIKLVKRWYVTYRPSVHPYIGHYDSKKYKKAMEKYKSGKLKARPNGRSWHKVRYNPEKGKEKSDLEILMANHNFTLHELRKEIHEKEKDLRLPKRNLLMLQGRKTVSAR